jgi:hypothetical protein
MGKDPKPEDAVKGTAEDTSLQLEELSLQREVERHKKKLAEIRESRIAEAIAVYKRKGTMVHVVDGFNDLSQEEKALLLDDAMTRAKGKPPKRNPFKEV